MLWRGRRFQFSFPGRTLIMGVVNVTPDSFSDGGKFFTPGEAVKHALRLEAEGADILDIGGESTRPGAVPISAKEELGRVIPVIQKLSSSAKVPISVDTTKPAVARAALEGGAAIINDISGNREDAEMWKVAAETGAGYVLMHMRGTPQTMAKQTDYLDLVAEMNEFFGDRLQGLAAAGVQSEQVILDVGVGFAKNAEQNLRLLAKLASFRKWNRPLLLGVSRKSFIGQVTGAVEPGDRLAGSIACACWAVAAGANVIRTHDVAATKQALLMTEAIVKAK